MAVPVLTWRGAAGRSRRPADLWWLCGAVGRCGGTQMRCHGRGTADASAAAAGAGGCAAVSAPKCRIRARQGWLHKALAAGAPVPCSCCSPWVWIRAPSDRLRNAAGGSGGIRAIQTADAGGPSRASTSLQAPLRLGLRPRRSWARPRAPCRGRALRVLLTVQLHHTLLPQRRSIAPWWLNKALPRLQRPQNTTTRRCHHQGPQEPAPRAEHAHTRPVEWRQLGCGQLAVVGKTASCRYK